jgi:transcriptional regulator with XRE-family HTH domain
MEERMSDIALAFPTTTRGPIPNHKRPRERKIFGEQLHMLRVNKRYTAYAFSKKTGISVNVIRALEKGNETEGQPATIAVLQKLADVLSCQLCLGTPGEEMFCRGATVTFEELLDMGIVPSFIEG